MRLFTLGMAALCLLLPFAARAQQTVTVEVDGNFFKTTSAVPGQNTNLTTINQGDTVHWVWHGFNHSVTSDKKVNGSPIFDSGVHNTGFTFDFTFNTPGTFTYKCVVHAQCCQMVGTITVATKMTGNISLDSIASNAPAQSVTFQLRPTDGSTPTDMTTTLKANGDFELDYVPAKAYKVAIKGAKWLQQLVSVDTTNGNVNGLNVFLPGGDVNGDNFCDIDDLGELAFAFGTLPSSPKWDPNADLTCDNKVDIDDLVVLANNYGSQGDF